jgi:acetyl-CoA carboxylase biotin carboxyl carrier protein
VSLTAAEVAEIMRLVEQSGFDELTLEMDGTKICIRRGAAPETMAGTDPPPVGVANAADSRGPLSPASEAVMAATTDRNVHLVAAPLLGTFYRAPKPGAPPFVEVGAEVEEETIVGILEVMKLMNTVRAGVRGTVIEIVVADGALAEYGQTLLRVRKAG